MQVHLEGVELSVTWKESQPQLIKHRKATTATMQGQLYLEPATELGKTARARASWRFAPKFQRVTVPRQCVRGLGFPQRGPERCCLKLGKWRPPPPPREGVGDTKALGNPMKKAAGMKWRWPKRKTLYYR